MAVAVTLTTGITAAAQPGGPQTSVAPGEKAKELLAQQQTVHSAGDRDLMSPLIRTQHILDAAADRIKALVATESVRIRQPDRVTRDRAADPVLEGRHTSRVDRAGPIADQCGHHDRHPGRRLHRAAADLGRRHHRRQPGRGGGRDRHREAADRRQRHRGRCQQTAVLRTGGHSRAPGHRGATYVTAGSTPTPIFGRQADTSPFWGGATIVNPSYGEECTSGWPVHFTDNPSGQFLLTANHCGSFGGGDKYYTPANTYIGNQIGQNDLQHDTLMVELDYSNSTAGSAIYTGGVNASGNYNGSGLPISFIEGSGTPEVGDYVCASGAFSGERCLVKITNTDVTSPPNTLYQHMVEAEQTNDTVGVAGQGDSGGPVYTPNEDGSVTALGTLSSIDPGTVVPCTGVQNRLCAWRVYFSNINDAIQYYAISVNGLG
ncbi:MAG TPA: trypsin-like serine protease [Pseudonocardiaceae bacterium]|nr:trypsin-like serine protease [Pseudonocardiaceae bacterium]